MVCKYNIPIAQTKNELKPTFATLHEGGCKTNLDHSKTHYSMC